MDSFDKVLEITGEITGEIIAPNAEGVDEEGPHCANGRVEYASGTKQNLDAMVKAGLNGMTMPRRFGGLNFPITPFRRDRKSTRLNSSHTALSRMPSSA